MAETETIEETEAERVSRSQMWKHEDAVAWLTEEGFIDSDSTQAEVIAAFAANRNAYRKTDRYRTLVENHASSQAEAREQAAAARAEAKAAKEAERQAAKEAKEAAAKAKADKESTEPEATPKAARKGKRGKAAASSDTDENPFG